ncbi:hypothetical protein ACLOJK_031827 [Asimina triloba]
MYQTKTPLLGLVPADGAGTNGGYKMGMRHAAARFFQNDAMSATKEIVAASSPVQQTPLAEADSQLTALICEDLMVFFQKNVISHEIPLIYVENMLRAVNSYEPHVSQQMQVAMENMLKMITEIDQSTDGIIEEIEKCKHSAVEQKKILEDEKDRFQKAALTVLEMLNVGEIN